VRPASQLETLKTMAESYDLILKGGIVVNQDGTGVRDIGIRDSRFAADAQGGPRIRFARRRVRRRHGRV
jgi:hypothetical protein